MDLVVAAGGDGTVHKTAWQVVDSGVPLAILPLGTANNLARSLGFTASVDEILQSLHCAKRHPLDIGVARNGSQKDFFLEAAGGGLFADYFPAAEANEREEASPQEQLRAHLSLLRKLACDYQPCDWKMSLDHKDISGRYVLWGAMNTRSAGPALRLASKAKTDDGQLDFVAVRENQRKVFIKYVDAHLAGKKELNPLTPRRFSNLKITSPGGAMHLDGELWPCKAVDHRTSHGEIEISLKRAALLICQSRVRRGRDHAK